VHLHGGHSSQSAVSGVTRDQAFDPLAFADGHVGVGEPVPAGIGESRIDVSAGITFIG
jgi:hypothetical protein